jgi:hypothetical protein
MAPQRLHGPQLREGLALEVELAAIVAGQIDEHARQKRERDREPARRAGEVRQGRRDQVGDVELPPTARRLDREQTRVERALARLGYTRAEIDAQIALADRHARNRR